MQMAAQGQSIFAAAGQLGALDDGSSLSVDDPGSQPYVTGAGGTTLTMNVDHSYASESSWWSAEQSYGGGGDQRDLADAKLADGRGHCGEPGFDDPEERSRHLIERGPAVGLCDLRGGQWGVYGGTSCAAPLWAAFVARVNERRAAGKLAPLGLANPAIYSVGKSAAYGLGFHDIADGSTNGHYPAVAGYDLATG